MRQRSAGVKACRDSLTALRRRCAREEKRLDPAGAAAAARAGEEKKRRRERRRLRELRTGVPRLDDDDGDGDGGDGDDGDEAAPPPAKTADELRSRCCTYRRTH